METVKEDEGCQNDHHILKEMALFEGHAFVFCYCHIGPLFVVDASNN